VSGGLHEEPTMTLATRQLATAIFLRLSLAVVLACAIGSFGSPVRASQGSAFNAFTSDVSLGPGRPVTPEKARRIQRASNGPDDPAVRAVANIALPSLLAAPEAAAAGAAWPAFPALPPTRIAALAFQARGPPLS
jgi:hypothetical protein